MKSKSYLAIDLGASGGRCLAGHFDGNRIELVELHQFPNAGVESNGRLYWDECEIWNQIVTGLGKSTAEEIEVASIGVDTWGVDFGLLDSQQQLVQSPFHYRDSHTRDIIPKAFEVLSREEIFSETGLQFMELNSLFQLFAMRRDNSKALENAATFLMMPDLFHWMLSGECSNELTNASTTQIYNPSTQSWSSKIVDAFQLPDIFQPISEPGTVLGQLTDEVCEATGISSADVVLPATHDTASAVLAVPAKSFCMDNPDWCYISSGTWSLMGIELAAPRLDQLISRLNFTNEAGVGGTTRLLKNISGLWLLQQCQKEWQMTGQDYDWSTLIGMASQESRSQSTVDTDDASFVAPTSMLHAINSYCERAGQPIPQTIGQYVRCCLESLAQKYQQVFNDLCTIVDQRISVIHIVGGGSQNELLCQMTADACRTEVVAGPVEATALGNILAQLKADRQIESWSQARQVVRESFPIKHYRPSLTA